MQQIPTTNTCVFIGCTAFGALARLSNELTRADRSEPLIIAIVQGAFGGSILGTCAIHITDAAIHHPERIIPEMFIMCAVMQAFPVVRTP